jgi:hypothetical protein
LVDIEIGRTIPSVAVKTRLADVLGLNVREIRRLPQKPSKLALAGWDMLSYGAALNQSKIRATLQKQGVVLNSPVDYEAYCMAVGFRLVALRGLRDGSLLKIAKSIGFSTKRYLRLEMGDPMLIRHVPACAAYFEVEESVLLGDGHAIQMLYEQAPLRNQLQAYRCLRCVGAEHFEAETGLGQEVFYEALKTTDPTSCAVQAVREWIAADPIVF